MKRKTLALLTIAAIVLSGSLLTASQKVTINGRLNCPTISHQGGTAYLQLSIVAPVSEREIRKPMNLAVVLDRSGSMADQNKIEYAKRAVRTLMGQLQKGDIFSFIIYDDVIEVLRRASAVRNVHELYRLLDEVSPRGATNLGGGLAEGLRQVERYGDKEYLNRVILLSDGLANRGITDPHELRRMVQQFRARSISVTTMGVGLEYNENLMVGLSNSGGGNYYFIESPQTLASIFQRELKSCSDVVAQNATVELTLAKGVRLLDAIGCEYDGREKRVVIPVGDLYSGEHRELTVELEIPEGSGTVKVVKGTLRYDGNLGWFESWPSFAVSVHYTTNFSEVDKNRDHEAQAKADVAVSTRRVDNALRALDKGEREEAARELKAAEATLIASPAAASGASAPMLNEQKAKLESFQRLLSDSVDEKRAKKAIQYENYKTQKSKQ
jgi:Ca-activated chloride channel family protein